MVLEFLVNPLKAERNPWQLLFIGAVYSSVALFMSLFIFSEHVGIVMVFLTTLASVFLVQRLLKVEEAEDDKLRTELHVLKHHARALSVFMFLFLGFVVAFSLWYIVLPSDTAHSVFGIQERTITCINSGVEGCATGTGAAFSKILLNNLRVMAFTLVFAFFYGAGSVFILAWNASVVATAVGIFARNGISGAASSFGLGSVASYFGIYSAGLLRYLTHGVFEILAYFTVALAGGIISIAVARHDFRSREFRRVVFDSADLVAIAFVTLVFAAVVEVFITPLLF